MSYSIWTPAAVLSEARPWQASVWRMVEAQHVASTMKIVDNQAEQLVLEELLEAGKPKLPEPVKALDYLLAAPFRYDPKRGGSRFRAVNDPGVFYGAAFIRTACAELGYWRWRFLQDAVDLVKLEPVAHTAFRVELSANAVDLRQPPFDTDKAVWMHRTDYSGTQAFADIAREAQTGVIVYQSVRDIKPAWCAAVLTPNAFAKPKPQAGMQTWWLAVNQHDVIWRRENEFISFTVDGWR